MARKGLVVLLIVVLATGFYWVWNKQNRLPGASRAPEVRVTTVDVDSPTDPEGRRYVQVRIKGGYKSDVMFIIHSLHNTLNDMTGYGMANRYADPKADIWNYFPKTELLAKADAVLEYVESDNLKQDLHNFKQAIEIAVANREDLAVKAAHRIVHDLDNHAFDFADDSSGAKDYWRATVTLEGSNSAVDRWIREYQAIK